MISACVVNSDHIPTDFCRQEHIEKMSNQIRRALLQIAPKARWSERAQKAAAILKSFSITFNPDGAVTASLDVDPMQGIGDSGMLANDLTDREGGP